MKVLSAKIPDDVYAQFVEKAKNEGRNQSQVLRNLIIQSIKGYTERPPDRILVLSEALKVFNEIQRKLENIVSSAKPDLISYLDMQKSSFERKLEAEKKR